MKISEHFADIPGRDLPVKFPQPLVKLQGCRFGIQFVAFGSDSTAPDVIGFSR